VRRRGRVPVAPPAPAKYPGRPAAVDGSQAVVEVETAAGEGAGAYPITPSTQMGEGWAAAVAAGKTNANGRRLVFFEPEGEHAAAAVTAGMSMTGMRATNFSSGQGVAYMHESLYAAAGKRLTYVLHMACRAMTKQALNVHCGHDDYHAVDDAGFFQVFAKDVQGAADLALVAHRIAELSLTPGICAQDGFLTSHVIESVRLPEGDLVREYLGDPSDAIESPTPAQRLVFGPTRRRIPEMFDVDAPAMLGVVENQDAYAQGVAAQRPFWFDHVAPLADRAFDELERLTGRRYARASGYRLDDAEWAIVGQGSVVANAEALADHLRERLGLRIGVLDVTMFRPFPADLVTRLLAGKRGAVVLERVDQPLAADPPLLREIRAAASQALENGRSGGEVPHPGVASYGPGDAPEFFSACFGLGSRDLQPGDLAAAVENMLPGGAGRRRFYLGVEFVRKATRLPKLRLWQERLLDSYPHLQDLSLAPVRGVDLLPEGSVAVRIHSVGGWGAITMGKNLTLAVYETLGLHVKANPKYGSEKKGQPTTFYAVFAPAPIRVNGELERVDVVLSPDPGVFRRADPLEGLVEGGVFAVQCDRTPEAFWASLPAAARRTIREKKVRVFLLDAFAIARAESSGPDLLYRLQGAAFLGAFWRATGLAAARGLTEERLWDGIRAQVEKKFGRLGARVVDANLRVVRRGHDEAKPVDVAAMPEGQDVATPAPPVPPLAAGCPASTAIADPGRFWEQVGSVCAAGEDVLADPFTAIAAIPASTGVFRDMTGIRQEIPRFVPERCTGCGQCWVQCPDAAIPGLVSDVDDVLRTALPASTRLTPLVKPLAAAVRGLVAARKIDRFDAVVREAWAALAPTAAPDAERRAALDRDVEALCAALAGFPLARTGPFFDVPESRAKGSGGLLSVTVDPWACKGCNVCVAVCPEKALLAVEQTDAIVEEYRRHWDLWRRLPDTKPRYLAVSDVDEGTGVLSTLLLRKDTYKSMVGGDGACRGCGEKTSVHLVVSAVRAFLEPKVARHVAEVKDLAARLDAKARSLLASGADLDAVARAGGDAAVPLSPDKGAALRRMAGAVKALQDLAWRYEEGPAGRGRAALGIANSTGCSSVWGGTFPYNPYPVPWVNHLFQDSPSVAIGLFEGSMRKMAAGFAAVRRARLLLEDAYDEARDEPVLAALDWKGFTDDEIALCPPILAVGGDGAMLDIGFQNLSRLLASGKPVRVVVLDTQVYSNTGGQACTSGYTGQVSDMAGYGAAQHGKTEARKELALIAMAHRGAYVLQSSQANPSHLLQGVLKGLRAKGPAVFNLYTPCPVEHGLADEAAPRAARMALESRAFPLLVYDPSKGPAFSDAISLEGNPALEDPWPTYDLDHVGDDGKPARLTLPFTIADWAATEGRFAPHFRPLPKGAWTDDAVPFHEYVALAPAEREGKTPFLHALGEDERLARIAVSKEIAALADERLAFWSQLKQLAGLEVSEAARAAALADATADFERRLAALRAEHEARVAEIRERLPQAVARRMAEGLSRLAKDDPAVARAIARLPGAGAANGRTAPPPPPRAPAAPSPAPPPAPPPAPKTPAPAPAAVAAAATATATADALAREAYVESERCTSCNECVNVNRKMFAYGDKKRAYVKDARAGTFQQLVLAAERCPVGIIHPGTPLDPKEKDLAKWVKRAERFG
jgi:pyruvate-ferredoxin/flavodoxin oxidoreductase